MLFKLISSFKFGCSVELATEVVQDKEALCIIAGYMAVSVPRVVCWWVCHLMVITHMAKVRWKGDEPTQIGAPLS
jgi:hypothetical protein